MWHRSTWGSLRPALFADARTMSASRVKFRLFVLPLKILNALWNVPLLLGYIIRRCYLHLCLRSFCFFAVHSLKSTPRREVL
jgi:hypothetical protein